jgi:pyridoxine kinase
MSLILSVQSHVAYGYVGNRAAMIPLHALGHEVIELNTVGFSNHPGYGKFSGRVFTLDELTDLVAGLKAQGLFAQIDAVLTGYIGDQALGHLVIDTLQQIRAENPDCLYCCDPVMGDVGRGFFVDEQAIPPFFQNTALQEADLIVPNQFEASYLAGMEIHNDGDALEALTRLHKAGAKRVVITSYQPENLPPEQISMLVSEPQSGVHQVITPHLALDPMPNGAGDVTAATLLGHMLSGKTLQDALALTAAALVDVFEATQQAQRRELHLIKAQSAFTAPSTSYELRQIFS